MGVVWPRRARRDCGADREETPRRGTAPSPANHATLDATGLVRSSHHPDHGPTEPPGPKPLRVTLQERLSEEGTRMMRKMKALVLSPRSVSSEALNRSLEEVFHEA